MKEVRNAYPETWEVKKLGDVMKVERGGSPRPISKYLTNEPDGINWIKISDASASNKYIYETKEKILREGLSKTRMVSEGDFLLSNSMSFGRPYIMKTTGCIHDGWLVLRDRKENPLEKEYLYYFLSSPVVFEEFDRLAAGSTVRNLNIALVSSVKIPLPPRSEQQRIVSILDEAFAAIDNAKTNVERNLQNACELFQSELNVIFTNKGEDWEEKKLGDVCKLINGRAYKKSELLNNGKYRVLRVGNFFTNNHWYFSDLELPEDKYCDKEDLLYAWSASFGPQIWKGEKVIYHYHIWKIIPYCQFVTKGFLYQLLLWDTANIKSAYGTGTTMIHVSKGSIEQRLMPIPPIEIQVEIVNKIEKLKTHVQSLESKYQQKLENLEELRKSILQKAFRGELTGKELVEA